MRYSHRFFLYAPVAALVVLAAAVALYWSVSVQAFARKLDAMNGAEVAPGVTLHFKSDSLSGFPFRVDAVLKNLRLDVAGPHGQASWQTEKFALHMLDYSAATLVFEAAGQQQLSWHDAAGKAQALSFLPGLLRASVHSRGGRFERFDIELVAARLADFAIARGGFHLRRDPKSDAFDLVATATDLHLISSVPSALGDVIPRFRLDARLAPGGPWDALFAGGGDWRSAAKNWQAHQGGLSVDHLEIAWGKADAKGAGLLMLDGARRPYGEIKLAVTGYQALADEAARRHLVKGPQQSLIAGVMAEADAAAPRDPGAPLPVTLAFKDGLAYVNSTPAGFLNPLY